MLVHKRILAKVLSLVVRILQVDYIVVLRLIMLYPYSLTERIPTCANLTRVPVASERLVPSFYGQIRIDGIRWLTPRKGQFLSVGYSCINQCFHFNFVSLGNQMLLEVGDSYGALNTS